MQILKNKTAVISILFVFSFFGKIAFAASLEELEKRLENLEAQTIQLRQDIALLKQKENASATSSATEAAANQPQEEQVNGSSPEDSRILKNSSDNLYSKGRKGKTSTSLTAKMMPNPYYKALMVEEEVTQSQSQTTAQTQMQNQDMSVQPQTQMPQNPTSPQENNAKNAVLTQAINKVQSGQFTEGEQELSAYVADSNNPNIGTAYYWLGKSYYHQKDYQKSAASYIEGYKTTKDTPLGSDVLLNLSLSLVQLNRIDEACGVLSTVSRRHPNEKMKIDMAEEEKKRLNCPANP